MTLVERTTVLRERCINLSTLGERIEEARSLGTRLGELRHVAEKLPNSLRKVGMLAKAGIAVPPPVSSVVQVRSAIAKIKARFAQSREADALTKGQDWKVLMRELPRIVGDLESASSESWESYAQQLFAGDAPAAVERTLAPTDANKAALAKYRQAHQRYTALKADVPSSAEEIAELARIAQELKSLKFDYDVPASVRKFLEALPAGAPLALLTDEVRGWIEQKGLTKRYQVVVGNR